MIGFWHRLRTGPRNKVSFILLKFLKKLSDLNTFNQNWITRIKDILNNTGLSYLWNFEGISCSKLKSTIKLRLKYAFFQNWESEIRENSLCRNYRLIKCNFGLERYLIKLNKDLRIVMTRYRTGSHNLPISDRRYDLPDDRNQCPLCHSDIGDEYHYIMNCTAFNHIRPNYISRNYITRPNTMKFQQLFSSQNLETLTKLSKFIKIIMHVFRQ